MEMISDIAEESASGANLREGETRDDRTRSIARNLLFAAGMELG